MTTGRINRGQKTVYVSTHLQNAIRIVLVFVVLLEVRKLGHPLGVCQTKNTAERGRGADDEIRPEDPE